MNYVYKQYICPELGVNRRKALRLLSPTLRFVGRHAARELKHLAGSLPRFVSPDRRVLSAARIGGGPGVQLVSRRLSCPRPFANHQHRVRCQQSVTVSAPRQCCRRASATITPAPYGVGVSRSAQSQYPSGMHSLAFHYPGFNAVRAQPGTRADARSSVSSTGGVPSRAAQLKR